MKKAGIILLTVIILSAVIFSACGTEPTASPSPTSTPSPTPSSTPAKVIELSYNNVFPPTHFNSVLAEEWINEIEKRTDGRVKINYYPASALAPGDKNYDAVVEGIADIGQAPFSYTMGRFPALQLLDLPHGYRTGWAATKVANEFLEEFKPAEINDTHPLYLHASGPHCIFTTEKPVRKLEDLKGLVLRATGTAAVMAEAFGAEGYASPQAEAYELMAKGVVDGAQTAPEVLKGWRQAEVVKYVTIIYEVGNTVVFFVVMNNDKWNSLPDDIKTIFTEVSKEWGIKHAIGWDWSYQEGFEYFLSFEGREIIELPPEESARWVTAVKPVVDEYLAEIQAKELPAAEMEQWLLERIPYWEEKALTLEESAAWAKENIVPLMPSE